MKGRAMRPGARRFTYRTLLYIAVLLIAAWVLAPYAWLIISSISTKIDLLSVPLKWLLLNARSPTVMSGQTRYGNYGAPCFRQYRPGGWYRRN